MISINWNDTVWLVFSRWKLLFTLMYFVYKEGRKNARRNTHKGALILQALFEVLTGSINELCINEKCHSLIEWV